MNLKVRKLSIDRHLMASAVTECQYTTFFSSLMFCRTYITGGCQVLEVFDPFCFFSSWSHHGHALCLQRHWVVSVQKNWIWTLGSFIEHCSWIRCAMSDNCHCLDHFHTWGIRNFGLNSSSEVSG